MKELVFSQLYHPAIDLYGDREGVVDGTARRTWAAHDDRVRRLSHALGAELGVSSSDRFAVLALNGSPYLELWHAAFLGAGVINPLNLRLAPKELAYILTDSESEVIFTDATFAPLVEAARKEMGGEDPIRRVVGIGPGDFAHDVAYEELLAGAKPTLAAEPEEDDAVVLMYTGGTTGLPKGVLLEHRAEILNVYHGAMTIPSYRPTSYLLQTPMFHAASMSGILAAGLYGGKTVMIPMFAPEGVLDLIEAEQVSDTLMVPTMIGMCFAHPAYRPERLASLERLVYGASPMPEAVLNKLLTELPDLQLIQGYGMTEACSTVSLLLPEEHVAGSKRLRSVGRPALGVQVQIQDDEGHRLPTGEIGEVCVRGGQILREYWKKPDATTEVLRDGWYHSGDAGYLDEEGYLFLVDRVKDMIVTGGENVYSAEVESAISTHPAVEQVAVIGIPHDTWGEQVHAIVVSREGESVTAEEIIAYARESIAGYKVPKSVDFRSEPLPLSGALKVLKRELREPYWKGHDKRIG